MDLMVMVNKTVISRDSESSAEWNQWKNWVVFNLLFQTTSRINNDIINRGLPTFWSLLEGVM